jgi:chemotaxis protein methyltransferase CheR
MINVITTNKSQFFRDYDHFAFIRRAVVPFMDQSGEPYKIWCAGCSNGQEPYSLSMILDQHLGSETAYKILATDISRPVLQKARAGIYTEEEVADVPKSIFHNYFEPAGEDYPGCYRIHSSIRRDVHFARLNLMSNWPMKGPFLLIFCRNVMIYFDKPTRQKLIERFRSLLGPGGYLFVGFSESLTGLHHGFKYVQPAVYRNVP